LVLAGVFQPAFFPLQNSILNHGLVGKAKIYRGTMTPMDFFAARSASATKWIDAIGITCEIENSTLPAAGSWTALAKPPVVETAKSISDTYTPGTRLKNILRLMAAQAP
jgi:hypothetical protein